MVKLLPVLLLAVCLVNSCFASTKIDAIRATLCGSTYMRTIEVPVKESVKLMETAENRNIDVSSCKLDMVTLKKIDAKNLLDSGTAIRDAVHSISNQLTEKNMCLKGLLGLRG